MFWQRYRNFRGFGHSRLVSFLNGALLDAEPYPPKLTKRRVVMEGRTLDYGSIGWGLNHARHGHKVRRKGWNGKDMWVTYVPAGAMQFPEKYGGAGDTQAMLVLHTPNGQLAVWTATTADLLASDWELADQTQPGSYA